MKECEGSTREDMVNAVRKTLLYWTTVVRESTRQMFHELYGR
jgi:hypothetical protein